MEKEKEKAFEEYIDMIEKSWTYNKFTKEEKENFSKMLHHVRTTKALKGSYKHRWDILQAIYGAYLSGLGYNGFEWREE